MKCAKCGYDDKGTGDTAHFCGTPEEMKKYLPQWTVLDQAHKERDRIIARLEQQDDLIRELEISLMIRN